MKTKLFLLAFLSSLMTNILFAQDRTTVTATTSDISDNLDLRAVASIFGDSDNLEDFERRLNDPKKQISNLDLNNDNQVDYLRVIESVEGNTHLVIIQSVLERDVFQDVATVEIEKDRYNNVQVQVVGDVYMYGQNYIYEPVYVYTPVIYNSFWVRNYRPYFSSWYYGYYPSYYYAWNPYPIYMYQNNINSCINVHHHYNYVNIRRSQRAIALHNTRRANGYEAQHPNRSFQQRNTVAANRHELDQVRSSQGSTRSDLSATNGTRPVSTGAIRNNTSSIRNDQNSTSQNTVGVIPRTNTNAAPRTATGTVRNTTQGTRAVTPNRNSASANQGTRSYTQQSTTTIRAAVDNRSAAPRTTSETVRSYSTNRSASSVNSSTASQRMSTPSRSAERISAPSQSRSSTMAAPRNYSQRSSAPPQTSSQRTTARRF